MSELIKHISVVELDFHHDVLDGFLRTFQDSSTQISVLTTERNIALLKSMRYSDNVEFYSYKGGSKFFFLRKYTSILESSQIVFINTIANDLGAYLAIDKKLITVLRVHNVNKQFQPFRNIFFPKSFFFAWKFFSYVVRQVVFKGFLFFRPIINKRIHFFTFPDQGITDYVKQMALVDVNKILPPIPTKIFSAASTSFYPYSTQLNVVIIGATDQRRRQYEEVIEALKLIYKKENAPEIKLTLLGNTNNAYGKKVIEQLNAINNAGFKLKFYTAQVAEHEFVECIKNSHLIISPITNNASTDIFKEVYGKTKTTGSINDFIKFGKVTLVPQHYVPPAELRDYIIKYENSTRLAEIILNLVQDEERGINTLNKQSLDYVMKNYSQEVVLKKTMAIFTHKVNHEQIKK